MAFSTGDIIYASTLNTVNGSVKQTWSWGHAGWSWSTRNAYFYVTKPSGTYMCVSTHTTSWGNQKKITLYRYENGSWVQKNYSDTASGNKSISMNSYGPGAYWYKIYDHNNTPSFEVTPCTANCVKGDYLCSLSDYPTGPSSGGYHSESTIKAMTLRSKGKVLTASLLNSGAVYTSAS